MVEFKQDMPPPGGYAPIVYKRVPLKPGWNPFLKAGIMLGVTTLGWIGFHYQKNRLIDENIELRCSRIATYPMLQAESDRMILKQLKRNRDAEEKIMKDVKGWELGKWNGLPVYLTLGPDEYYKPHPSDYYAHSDRSIYSTAYFVYFNH